MTETDCWNKWRESEEGKSCGNVETLKAPKDQEQFLRNRLWRAFMAGCHAGRELREEDIVHRITMFLRGRVV